MDAGNAAASGQTVKSPPAPFGAGGGKHLTFSLGRESYGVDIRMIREIIGIMDITPLPDSDASVRGVINLRGKIIPVVDLRVRFGLPQAPFTERTCIVVVDLEKEDGGRSLVGAIVDAVSEVSNIAAADVEPPPEMGMGSEAGVIKGMAKLKERVVILLDIGKILGKFN
jgi:purine-binding chemotaxis protein CheW